MSDLQVSPAGRKLIEDNEGCELTAYRDMVGVLTIGYGHIEGVYEGQTISQAEADQMLTDDLNGKYGPAVLEEIGDAPTTQGQFDSMVSLAYNVGTGRVVHGQGEDGFDGSSVARFHKAGDYAAAADAFLLWDHAGGRVVQALLHRREEERAIYLEASAAPVQPPVQDPVKHAVILLQAALNAVGASPPLAEDGVAGERTLAALAAHQRGA